jgi:hypothetical protein
MGINLHLVDQRSPRGFTLAFAENDPVNKILRIERPQLSPPLLRPRAATPRRQRDPRWALYSLIGPEDTMSHLVSSIMHQYSRAGLDLIRIEAHGEVPASSSIVEEVQLGAGMGLRGERNVGYFYPIALLWSHAYSGSPVRLETPMHQVFPRIEFHACEPVPGCNAMLQALANAARAYVFASAHEQTVDLTVPRGRRFMLQGTVHRFYPQGPGAERITAPERQPAAGVARG